MSERMILLKARTSKGVEFSFKMGESYCFHRYGKLNCRNVYARARALIKKRDLAGEVVRVWVDRGEKQPSNFKNQEQCVQLGMAI